MHGYTADEVRAAEAPLLAAGVPLMARAASGLADAVSAELSRLGVPVHEARILLLVGSGDNGGDTLHAGALLARRGADVDYAPLGSRTHREGEAAALAAGATRIDDSPAGPEFRAALAAADAILDGIVGIGATAGLREPARTAVVAARERVAEREGPLPATFAVDLPSGIHPDTGEAAEADAVLPADVTVTFGACKAGLLRADLAVVGRIELVDIGLGLPA
ncbi:NAD(P)H-hydrate epimerase [Protaetiibacter sp. SSC-01]|uniref:NAD(P)H-hydrate epimerase n=1 Tax=Protaetiibacter sp. SSC-01 TaxID=2759943 RepID=UPI00223BA177|nr:NAD(P)H-hydrate epimerase [Protaetiibacter sp. SSC-01]